MTDRERFEAWRTQVLEALDLPVQGEFDKDRGGVYEYSDVRYAWDAWQASRKQAIDEIVTLGGDVASLFGARRQDEAWAAIEAFVDGIKRIANPEGEQG